MADNPHVDRKLREAIQKLVDDGRITDQDTIAVASKVVHEGHDALTPEQAEVYRLEVEALLASGT